MFHPVEYFTASFRTDANAFLELNYISFNDMILLAVLFFGYFGLLIIGLIFKNPGFEVLSVLFGIIIGVLLLKVNYLIGIGFIFGNIIGAVLTLTKS